MDTKTKTILMWSGVALLVVAGIYTLFLSFGANKKLDESEVNAIYTNAASTIAAQQLTMQAMITPSPTASLTPLPTSTFLVFSTPVLLPTINLAAVTASTPAAGCDNAVYVSDVTIPDGTKIPVGQSFTKTWKVANKGTCAWSATYQLVFVGGDSMGGSSTPIGKIVNPGESVDISVVLIAPSASGESTGKWRLSNDKGIAFGNELTVVVASGAAVPATPTGATGESTATEEPTATDVPTATEEVTTE